MVICRLLYIILLSLYYHDLSALPSTPPTALADGSAEVSLQQAEKLMKTVQGLSEKDLPNKKEFIASLYSCIGNAQLELGEAEAALRNHLEDLKISEDE